MQIDQFVPYLGYGDAVSAYSVWIRDALRRLGHRSTIYAEQFDNRMRREGEPFTKYRGRGEGKVILHYLMACSLSDFVLGLGKKIVLIYHNITPHEYFRPFGYRVAENTRKAREGLGRFVEITELALGVSEFNREELEAAGFRNTGVLPIPLNRGSLEIEPDRKVLRKFGGEFTNFLFVGRIAPNKRQDEVLKVFAYYSKVIDSDSRLFLVGSSSGTEVYLEWLKWLAGRLGLENVHFAGHVTQSELVAYYKLADAFVCMSEHEGFCVPLLESMHFQLPIVAYACQGVAETLGDAGVLVKAKEYDVIAETLHLLVTDQRLRRKVIERQNVRLQAFAPERVEEKLRGYFGRVTVRRWNG